MEGAFRDIDHLENVIIEDGCTAEIPISAFSKKTNLNFESDDYETTKYVVKQLGKISLFIPPSISDIQESFLVQDGNNKEVRDVEGVAVYCGKGSLAMTWARKQGIKCLNYYGSFLIDKNGYVFIKRGKDYCLTKYIGNKNIALPNDCNGEEYILGNVLANSSITEISIPRGVVAIDDYAFSGCSLLKKIVIPSSVKKIGCKIAENCDSLSEVYFEDVTGWIKGSCSVPSEKISTPEKAATEILEEKNR